MRKVDFMLIGEATSTKGVTIVAATLVDPALTVAVLPGGFEEGIL
jgi:hypothetical protein